jgi:hypothetical protein
MSVRIPRLAQHVADSRRPWGYRAICSNANELVKRAQERMTWKAKRHAGRQANLSGHRIQAMQSYVKRCQA